MLRFVALFLTVPLVAQAPSGRWTLGAFGVSPGLTGQYRDYGSSYTDFDIEKDFKLGKDGTGIGLHMEYSGPRFGFSVSYGTQDYAGRNEITRSFKVADIEFKAGMDVTSSIKHTVYDANWTIKLLSNRNAWLGVDLGIQGWYLDVEATGMVSVQDPDFPTPAVDFSKVDESYIMPIPHIGISGGLNALDNRFVIGAKAHFLIYRAAKYTRFAADARYYFLPWLGIRVFADTQSVDAPESSIINNVDANLDRTGVGFGIVARW